MKMVGLQTGVLFTRSFSVAAAIAALLVFKYDSSSASLHVTELSALSTMLCGHLAGYLVLLLIQLGRVLLGLPALPQQRLPCLGLLLLDAGLAVCMFGIYCSGVSFVEHTFRYRHDALATRLKFHAALGLVAGQSASAMAILEFFLAYG